MVDMSVDTEQTFENGLGNRREVLHKRHADLGRKDRFIIELILHPGHQIVDVTRCGTFDRLLDGLTICPMVFIFGPGSHQHASAFRAELSDRSIEHVDLIEEIHN